MGEGQLFRHNSVIKWQKESNEKYNDFVLSTLGLGEVKPKQSDEIDREQYSTGEAPIGELKRFPSSLVSKPRSASGHAPQ